LVGFPAHCRAILLPIAPTPLIQAVGTHSQPLSNISHSVPTLSNLANGFDLKFFGKSFRLCAHAHDTSRYPHYEANECLGYPGRFRGLHSFGATLMSCEGRWAGCPASGAPVEEITEPLPLPACAATA